MQIPEIAEADACGDTALFYEKLRRESGSAVINFVWRYIATVEHAGDWCWSVASRSDIRSAAVRVEEIADASASRILDAIDTSLPLSEAAREIVVSYNTNNALNAMRIANLIAAIREPEVLAEPAFLQPIDEFSVSSDSALPELPSFASLRKEDLESIEGLAEAGPAAASQISPSLWRHLSTEPALLQKVEARLKTVLSSYEFRIAWQEICRLSLESARPAGPLPPADLDTKELLAGLERFHSRICEMALIGRVLLQRQE